MATLPNVSPSRWMPRVPAPLQRLFDRFPLVTYEANELPSRAPRPSALPTLYVFVSEEDALRGAPSFNPTCLKWQTFLKIAGVQFRIVPSTNHASPSGALPFLLPPASEQQHQASSTSSSSPFSPPRQHTPIPASRLRHYALAHGPAPLPDEHESPRLAAYQALLDTRIRTAWLHALYLDPANADVLTRLYIEPSSSVPAMRAVLAHQLRRAAETEIVKTVPGVGGGGSARGALAQAAIEGRMALGLGSGLVDAGRVYADARGAFEALDQVLGESGTGWFSGGEQPGLFDAAVFTYVHLMLVDGRMGWTAEGRRRRARKNAVAGRRLKKGEEATSFLEDMVADLQVPNLRTHHERLWTMLWPELAAVAEKEKQDMDDEEDGELVHLDEKVVLDVSDSVEHIVMTESLMQAR